MTSGSILHTVRDVRAALRPFPHVSFRSACAMLATRSLFAADDATLLEKRERERFERLVALLRSATDRTGDGYVGIRWTTVRTEELGGRTAIEALRTREGARTVMNIVRRRQAELATELADGQADSSTSGHHRH